MTEHTEPPGDLVWDVPEPSGRGPRLSREAITRAAIGIADAEGEQAVTMRRLATELGSSTPMSLYRYVGSKDGVRDLMLDQVFAEIELPDTPPGDWRQNLELLAHASRVALRRHAWFTVLSHHRPMFGPHALANREWSLATVDGHGLTPTQAMSVSSMVFGYAMSYAQSEAEELRMRTRIGVVTDEELRAKAGPAADRIVASPAYPRLGRWIAEGGSIDPDEQFQLGLDCLLDGIAGRVFGAAGG